MTDKTAEDELNYQVISAIVIIPENFEYDNEVRLKITLIVGQVFSITGYR